MTIDMNDPRITAYAFGELEGEARTAFEQELAESAELREQVDQTQTMIAALQQELRREPAIELTEQQRERVQGAMRQAAAAPVAAGTGAGWRLGPKLLAVAAIAACLVLLATPLLWRTMNQPLVATNEAARAPNEAPDALRRQSFDREQLDRELPAPMSAAPAEGFAEGAASRPAGEASQLGAPFAGNELATAPASAAGLSDAPAAADGAYPKAAGPGGGGAGGALGAVSGGLPGPPGDKARGAYMVSPTPDPRGGYPGSPPASSSGLPEVQLGRYSTPQQLTPGLEAPVVGEKENRAETLSRSSEADADESLVPDNQAVGGRFAELHDNPFEMVNVAGKERSTFSIDVDTASYAKVRNFLSRNMLPPPEVVRIEELVNYFDYEYAGPPESSETPFASHIEVAECPWSPKHRLVRVAVKGREMARDARPASNLVFLLDVSGSMNQPNKLPLLKSGMQLLVSQLNENDMVSIVVYAGAAGMVLPPTSGDQKAVIMEALERLQAGGSTAGAAGIQLAYQTAVENFIEGGANRVILCTDGDFNVGVSNTADLVRLAEDRARSGVFLSVLAFGMDNHNDEMLEEISNKGNGNYAFVDTLNEAKKVLVDQMSATLVTIAKDVKLQVEFNPRRVVSYRLIGYENRVMANADFRNDQKDAGEIGAGHRVTALYEIALAEPDREVQLSPDAQSEDEVPLRYQAEGRLTEQAASDELLTLFVRYKQPAGDTATELEFPVSDGQQRFGQASQDYRFASAVAGFGMLLRKSPYAGDLTWDAVEEIAAASASPDPFGYRAEFLELVRRAKELAN